MTTRSWLTTLSLVAAIPLTLNPAAAQLPGLNKAKEAAEAAKKAAAKADSIKKALAADSAKKATAKADSVKAATAAATTPAGGAAATAPDKTAEARPQDPKVWDNYDFVPGNKVIFFTDFTEDRVGNFARRLKYVNGPMDVVEVDGVRMLRSTAGAEFLIPLGQKLPERFTIEFDIVARTSGGALNENLRFDGGAGSGAGEPHVRVYWHSIGANLRGSGQNLGTSPVTIPEPMQAQIRGKLAHVRLLMDGPYFKLYTNERRLYNIPELSFRRDSVIRVFMGGLADNNPVYLAMIRVAESETDVLYDALAAKGRWATQGILFATGKAELQPESRPVLKEIAATLKDHADLKILIEGHTDNVGNAATNLTLSDARAAAVKAALVSDFGIAADRITTKGLGDTKPSAPNTSAEGRAQNRRVEIVKQ